MPWGVHSEYTEQEESELPIDDDRERIDRGEEGAETTEDFDIDEAISDLD